MSQNIKKICSFQIFTEQEVDKIEDTVDDKGEKIQVKRKIKEKVPQNFFLRRPTRSINEDATLFEQSKYSEAIRNNILPYFLLKKKLYKTEEIIPDQERSLDSNNKEQEINAELEKITEEYRHLKLKKDAELTEKDKNRIRELETEFSKKQLSLLDFQTLRPNIWEKSAEAFARNKMTIWYMLFLSYKEENGVQEEFFKGANYEDKLKVLDNFENEDNQLNNRIINRFLLYTAFWINNQDAEEKDFEDLHKMFEQTENKTE